MLEREFFYLLKLCFLKHVVSQKNFFQNGLLLLQIATRFSKWGKHVAKKTVVPIKRVSFIRAWITLHSCTLKMMNVSVHHFLYEKRSLLYITNTFPSMILRESICTKLGGTMIFWKSIKLGSLYKICHSIDAKWLIFWRKMINWRWVIDSGGEWFQKLYIIKTR